jgi:hypothetical protein
MSRGFFTGHHYLVAKRHRLRQRLEANESPVCLIAEVDDAGCVHENWVNILPPPQAGHWLRWLRYRLPKSSHAQSFELGVQGI